MYSSDESIENSHTQIVMGDCNMINLLKETMIYEKQKSLNAEYISSLKDQIMFLHEEIHHKNAIITKLINDDDTPEKKVPYICECSSEYYYSPKIITSPHKSITTENAGNKNHKIS